MPLRLRVISYKGIPSSTDLSATFDERGGTIGRKNENTLVLTDPENFVSGRHAEVFYQNGRYRLKDTSKNGTFLVKADISITGEDVTLQNNEILRIGEYEVQVEIDNESTERPILDFSAIDRGPFSKSFEIEPNSPIASTSNSSVFGHQIEKPLFDLAPNQSYQDSFSPPDVLSANVSPFKTQERDIAELLKGLDSLAPTPPFGASEIAGTADAPKSSALEVAPETYSAPKSQGTYYSDDQINDDQVPSLTAIKDLSECVTSTNANTTPGTTRDNSELLRCFLQGAGINDLDFLPESQRSNAMTAAGKLFRDLIEGLMDVLRVRAEMKSEFRVSVTTIRSTENNPLKFNPDVESVLKLMLAPNNPAFIAPDVAVTEAFRDLRYHQMAVTAGIQASLAEILRRFEPEAFEKTLGEGLVFQKKARCWELYCEKYPELKSLAVEEFFGEEFADAYEKQMHLFNRR